MLMSTCSEFPLRLTYGKTVIGAGLHPIPQTQNISQHLRIRYIMSWSSVIILDAVPLCAWPPMDKEHVSTLFTAFTLHPEVITTLALITKPSVLPLQFISIIQYPRLWAIILRFLKVYKALEVIFLTNVAAHYIQLYNKFSLTVTINFFICISHLRC